MSGLQGAHERLLSNDSPEKTRRRAARFHCPISLIAASLSLNPDLLRATGVCLHVDLFATVGIDDQVWDG